ncbi:MAG: thioredoxin family protein [Phycisphaerales bacterium]|nr:thioredoxin family protein [Phycisphaerales bacterium]
MALTPSTMIPLGTHCPDFALIDVTARRTVQASDFSARPILVIFLCNHCPYVVHIQHALATITDDYPSSRLGIVGICSNDVTTHPEDGPQQMAEMAREQGWAFPYLHDPSQDVARAFGAACTPDFFLFDRSHALVYRGQLDESRPGNHIAVTGRDLRMALDAVLSGAEVSAQQRPSMGCNIKWKQ